MGWVGESEGLGLTASLALEAQGGFGVWQAPRVQNSRGRFGVRCLFGSQVWFWEPEEKQELSHSVSGTLGESG